MGVTKQYLHYKPCSIFGVVGSSRSNIVSLTFKGEAGRMCAMAACEHVFIWDVVTKEKVSLLEGDKHEVTALACCPRKFSEKIMAVGYSNGTVKLFNLSDGTEKAIFAGHRNAISALNFDNTGMRLVSGSHDTEIIVWDVTEECGLFRLRGHTAMITQARFLSTKDVLITSSKDTFVKFWDLETQHCFKTVTHKQYGEVRDFVVYRNETRLITGAEDNKLRLFELGYYDELTDEPSKKRQRRESTGQEITEEEKKEERVEDLNIMTCTLRGEVERESRGKGGIHIVTIDETHKVLCVSGRNQYFETFRLYNQEEIATRYKKRVKKARKKAKSEGKDEALVEVEETVHDEITHVAKTKLSARISAIAIYMWSDKTVKVMSLLNNNMLEICGIFLDDQEPKAENFSSIASMGHRSDPRVVQFSSDNSHILSASEDSLKFWSREEIEGDIIMRLVGSMPCGQTTSAFFCPGNQHIIIGTKSGTLEIYDLRSKTLLEEVPDAHEKQITGMALLKRKHFLTVSEDCYLKQWTFELVKEENSDVRKVLTVVCQRSLNVNAEANGVITSPDGQYILVSLLNNNVKIFYADTLKFKNDLYGHKLPVRCMDVSTDGSMIATGSDDCSIKIWSMDFNELLKSIYAHAGPVTCLKFQPKTHTLWSGGMDNIVKQWDVDSKEQIQTLKDHLGGITSLDVTERGGFLVTASQDKSLRLFYKTDETLILSEERELERDEEEQAESVARLEGPTAVPGEFNKETGLAGKKTIETMQATEKIMEMIELYREESAKQNEKKEGEEAEVNILFKAFNVESAEEYVLFKLKKIRASELEEALLSLPFSYVPDLMTVLTKFVEKGWEMELTNKCLYFLIRINDGQITSNHMMQPIMEKLEKLNIPKVRQIQNKTGSNLTIMKFIARQLEEREEEALFMDATDEYKKKQRAKKRKQIYAIMG